MLKGVHASLKKRWRCSLACILKVSSLIDITPIYGPRDVKRPDLQTTFTTFRAVQNRPSERFHNRLGPIADDPILAEKGGGGAKGAMTSQLYVCNLCAINTEVSKTISEKKRRERRRETQRAAQKLENELRLSQKLTSVKTNVTQVGRMALFFTKAHENDERHES